MTATQARKARSRSPRAGAPPKRRGPRELLREALEVGGGTVAVVRVTEDGSGDRVVSGDPATAEVVVAVSRYSHPPAAEVVAYPPRSLAAQPLGAAEAPRPPDAPAPVRALPAAMEAVRGDIDAQLEPFGPAGWHAHSYGADGRCSVGPGCQFTSPLLAVEAQARQEAIALLQHELALGRLHLGGPRDDESPAPLAPLKPGDA